MPNPGLRRLGVLDAGVPGSLTPGLLDTGCVRVQLTVRQGLKLLPYVNYASYIAHHRVVEYKS
eukprot:scaffold295198_cov16-Prasinocladus_malaysianus.AAC.1